MYRVGKTGCCLLLLATAAFAQTGGASDSTAQQFLDNGKRLYTQEGPKAALPDLEQALKLFRSAGDQHGEAITLGYIANCQRKLGNLDQSLELAQKALSIKQKLGDEIEVGKTHNQLGLIYWERADYPTAIMHLQGAIEIASRGRDKELEGSARNNLGLVFDEKGDYSRSLEQYQKALDLHRASHFERGEGDTLGNIGGIYLLLGEFGEALPYYRQALTISEKLGLKPASSDDLGNIALCLAGTGDVDGALASFDRALQVARDAGLAKEEADWHKGKGTTLVALGRYDAALHEYAAAEQVYERSGLQRELVQALNDTGAVFELLGDGVSADARFQRALQLAQKIGNNAGETASSVALGDMERRRKRYDAADAYFGSALNRAHAAGDDGTVSAALLQRARNDIDREKYDRAITAINEADKIASRIGNVPTLAEARYLMGDAQRAAGQFQNALEEYDSAEVLQAKLRDPELGWRVAYGRGRTFENLNKSDAAIGAYESAIAIIENTRSEIPEERYRAGYIEDRYQVYVALVELLLKLHRFDDAFVYSEKMRERAYLDQFGSAVLQASDAGERRRMQELEQQIRRLRHAIQKEYSTAEKQRHGEALESYSKELNRAEREYQDVIDNSHVLAGELKTTTRPDEVQAELSPDAALVEYVIGEQTLATIVITKTAVQGIAVPASSDTLLSRVQLLRELILERSPDWNQPAAALSKVLLGPVQSSGVLKGIRKILFVPDGILNYVPFSALPLAAGHLLSDDFTVAYVPTAAALVNGVGARDTGRSILAMAPAEAHLVNAGAEVRTIADLFPRGSQVVTGRAATETLFKRIAQNYDYLHIASHGSLNRVAPSLSALELEADDQNDGRLELHEIIGMKLHARLVTLSACETALGTGYFSETPAGDEFVGLTRAFMTAGSRNVLASLWAVNDAATRALMVRFYRRLLSSGTADALAQAQRDLRHRQPEYRHPYYWAAFVMAGPIN